MELINNQKNLSAEKIAFLELKKRKRELEIANKELKSFAYSVSHDLRAPLRSISGFANILREDSFAQLGEQGKDCIDRICVSIKNMEELLDNFLSLSKIVQEEIIRVEVNLSGMAHDILNSFLIEHPRQIEIKISPDIIVYGDRNLLKIALINLLDNAWKFTNKKELAQIEFGSIVKNKKTIYFVKDNGAGFDMKRAERLFIPFHRLHKTEEFPGNGIGLATVWRIIHRHGGHIWAQSIQKQETVFYFTLE